MEIKLIPEAEKQFLEELSNRANILKQHLAGIADGMIGYTVSGLQQGHSLWLQKFRQMCYIYVSANHSDEELAEEFREVVHKYVSKMRTLDSKYNFEVEQHTLVQGLSKKPTNLLNMVILCAGTARAPQVRVLVKVNNVEYLVEASTEIMHGADNSITLMTCVSRWDQLTEFQRNMLKREINVLDFRRR